MKIQNAEKSKCENTNSNERNLFWLSVTVVFCLFAWRLESKMRMGFSYKWAPVKNFTRIRMSNSRTCFRKIAKLSQKL